MGSKAGLVISTRDWPFLMGKTHVKDHNIFMWHMSSSTYWTEQGHDGKRGRETGAKQHCLQWLMVKLSILLGDVLHYTASTVYSWYHVTLSVENVHYSNTGCFCSNPFFVKCPLMLCSPLRGITIYFFNPVTETSTQESPLAPGLANVWRAPVLTLVDSNNSTLSRQLSSFNPVTSLAASRCPPPHAARLHYKL